MLGYYINIRIYIDSTAFEEFKFNICNRFGHNVFLNKIIKVYKMYNANCIFIFLVKLVLISMNIYGISKALSQQPHCITDKFKPLKKPMCHAHPCSGFMCLLPLI